jgi:predicted metal-dependent phosphotriesterase family hydrolase
MTEANIVRGPVDGSRLRRTLMHERTFVLSPETGSAAGITDTMLVDNPRAILEDGSPF